MTPKELATAYAETIYSPANGWGQHCHPTLGQSHSIMIKLSQLVGNDECEKLIGEAMSLKQAAMREQLEFDDNGDPLNHYKAMD